MLNVKAKIDLLKGVTVASGVIDKPNNAISAPFDKIINNNNTYNKNPFIIGQTIIGELATLSKQEKFYLGSELATNNAFSSDYVITLNSVDAVAFPNLSIIFDSFHNAYPTSINVNGENINVTNYQVRITKALPSPTTIKFNTWSKSNSLARIEGIYSGETLELDRITFNITHKDRSKNDEPSYGVIANSGNITYVDTNAKIKKLINDKLLLPNQNVEIFLEDNLSNKKETIGTFKTKKWDYNINTFVIKITLYDYIQKLQNIKIDTKFIGYNKTLDKYLLYLKTYVSSDINIQISEQIINYLKSIVTPTLYINHSISLWEGFNQLCKIAQLHMYTNVNGQIILGE